MRQFFTEENELSLTRTIGAGGRRSYEEIKGQDDTDCAFTGGIDCTQWLQDRGSGRYKTRRQYERIIHIFNKEAR